MRLLNLGVTMLLILNLAGASAAGPAPAPAQRVLVLYSDERLLPANIIMDEAIRAAFAVGTNNRGEFYSEFLDVARFPGKQQRQRDFFRDKYRERPPNLVIAVSGGAMVFLSGSAWPRIAVGRRKFVQRFCLTGLASMIFGYAGNMYSLLARANVGDTFSIASDNLVLSRIFTLASFFCRLVFSVRCKEEERGIRWKSGPNL